MTIAFDIRSLHEPGGVSEYTRNLLLALLEKNTRHDYVLFSNAYHPVVFPSFPAVSNVSFVSYRYPNKLLNASLLCAHRPHLDALVRRKSGKSIDLFFAPNLNFFAFSKHVKKILTVHDISFDLYPEFLRAKSHWWHRSVRPKYLFHSFDHLIAVSDRTKRDLVAQYHIPETKITTIHLGIDVPAPCRDIPTVSSRPIDFPYILACAGQESRKNITSLLLAFDHAYACEPRLRNYYMVVSVQGSFFPKDTARTLHSLRFRDRILIKEYLPDQEWKKFIRHAQLFVYPSLYEGFGFPPLEAMSVGVPVIVAANSSLVEISGSASLLIDSYNIRSFARGLISALLDDTLRKVLIQKGYKESSRFRWDICAKKTLDVIEKICV